MLCSIVKVVSSDCSIHFFMLVRIKYTFDFVQPINSNYNMDQESIYTCN